MEGKLFEPLGHVGERHGESLDGCEGVLEIQGVGVGIYPTKLHHLKKKENLNVFRMINIDYCEVNSVLLSNISIKFE